MPQMAKVTACSRSLVVSANGGSAVSRVNSSALVVKIASAACADAVNKAVNSLCKGGDPMATISLMSSTCASAITQIHASTVSGTVITPATYSRKTAVKPASYLYACSKGCINGESSAQAVAMSAACAWTAATKGCQAVKGILAGNTYASAFIKTTAKAWSEACSLGIGKATGTGDLVAKTTVSVISKAFGELAVSACSNCDTCQCAPLPKNFNLTRTQDFSNGVAKAAEGRYAIAKLLSQATAAYCQSNKTPTALAASLNGTLNALANMTADIFITTSGSNYASGESYACSGAMVSQNVQVSMLHDQPCRRCTKVRLESSSEGNSTSIQAYITQLPAYELTILA